jgi:acetyl-CoA/propionyl-CoA carboxylase, biotin carboxylase, biotin carboxyl carrier protein
MDSGVYTGFTIPPFYDSLIAKVITWGPDREVARRRMLRALGEYRIGGPDTTIPFDLAVLQAPEFINGGVDTTYIGRHLDELIAASIQAPQAPSPSASETIRTAGRSFEVEVNRRFFQVRVAELQKEEETRQRARRPVTRSSGRALNETGLLSPMHGTVVAVRKAVGDAVEVGETLFVIEAMKMENEVGAQRAGTITEIAAQVGETVEADQRLAVIE